MTTPPRNDTRLRAHQKKRVAQGPPTGLLVERDRHPNRRLTHPPTHQGNFNRHLGSALGIEPRAKRACVSHWRRVWYLEPKWLRCLLYGADRCVPPTSTGHRKRRNATVDGAACWLDCRAPHANGIHKPKHASDTASVHASQRGTTGRHTHPVRSPGGHLRQPDWHPSNRRTRFRTGASSGAGSGRAPG